MTQLLGEVQTAALLGYADVADFRKAVRTGHIPPAIFPFGRNKPRWRHAELVGLVDRVAAAEDSMFEDLMSSMQDAAA